MTPKIGDIVVYMNMKPNHPDYARPQAGRITAAWKNGRVQFTPRDGGTSLSLPCKFQTPYPPDPMVNFKGQYGLEKTR